MSIRRVINNSTSGRLCGSSEPRRDQVPARLAANFSLLMILNTCDFCIVDMPAAFIDWMIGAKSAACRGAGDARTSAPVRRPMPRRGAINARARPADRPAPAPHRPTRHRIGIATPADHPAKAQEPDKKINTSFQHGAGPIETANEQR
jgi:hypothetical protein